MRHVSLGSTKYGLGRFLESMMRIGTVKEIKDNENRVGLTPKWAAKLVKAGHSVYVEKGAGEGTGFSDDEYRGAGARLFERPFDVVKRSDILVKVKEPLPSEYRLLDHFRRKTLYTYLHLAAVDKGLTLRLIDNGITAIDYATVEDRKGSLPLLKPMSEVAGVLAVQYAAEFLQKKHGGRGITIGHIGHVRPAEVVIVGAGVVGRTAAKTATGMGARVKLLDIDDDKVVRLREEMRGFLGQNLFENLRIIDTRRAGPASYVAKADVLIGAVLVKGARAPEVVTEKMVKSMKSGAVIVDVAVDQGGCIWGVRPTTHSDPTYIVDDKIFCCVANMPGQASLQSTEALTYATCPHLLKMAKLGIVPYLKRNRGFARGVNVHRGKVVYAAVAEALGLMQHYQPLAL